MLQLFRRLTRQEALLLLVSVGLVFLGVILDLEVPSYMSEITTLLQTEGTSVADILSPGFKMIGLSLASFAMAVAVGFIAARVAASFTTRLREQIFSQVMAYSQAEIKGFSIPSLLTRTTNDLTQLQVLITMGLQVVTKGPIMAIWAMGKIAGKNDQWLLATTVAVVAFILMAAILLLLAFPKQSVAQGLTDKLNSITREILTGIRVVRAYNAEDYEDKKFAQANEEVTQLNLYIGRLMTIFNPSMTLISGGLTLAIYWIGSSLINDAQATDKILVFSDMIVFASYAMQVIIGFMLMIAVFFILPRALVSSKRIKEVLNLSSSVQFPDQTVAVAEGQGLLEFEDVSFRYSKTSEAVIEHVTFKALPGQTVAFIGSTGSGKSTLVNLIPRFYDATQGQIKLDGRPLKSYSQEELSQKVGYIPQKAVLFSGTVKSNMTMGLTGDKSLTDSQIWEALELAQAKTFVQEKEAGLETEVAQGGSNFSGGQRQRLAIARALARKPEILIFDDSFSALDYKTDKVLRAALKAETHQRTKLIVAQRISTIMDADHILVLDQGKVVGQGTHQELLASNPVYQEIAYSQLSEEELAHGK